MEATGMRIDRCEGLPQEDHSEKPRCTRVDLSEEKAEKFIAQSSSGLELAS
jgi:antirestriction protein ArdC